MLRRLSPQALLPLALVACQQPEPGDSGVPPVPATIELGEPVTCEDPTARDDGPLRRWTLGADWADTQPDDTTPLAPDGEIPPFGSMDAAEGITMVDFTGDDVPDLWVPRYDGDLLFVSQPDGTWVEDIAARIPATDAFTWAFGAVAGDVDDDADMDLLVSYTEGGTRLLLNDGTGVFTDGEPLLSEEDGMPPSSGGSLGDIDGDGDLDFAVSVLHDDDAPDGLGPHDVLWRNDGGGVFTDISSELPTGLIERQFGRLAALLDLDDDGDLDLYLESDDQRKSSNWYLGNGLFWNDGSGTFSLASDDAGLNMVGEAMGLGLGDLNGDRLPDVAVSDTYKIWMMLSIEGGWYDASAASGVSFDSTDPPRVGAWGDELVDLDNDGDLDLPVVFGVVLDYPELANTPSPDKTDALWLNDGGTFTEVASEWGWNDQHSSHGLAVLDIDMDGWLDLVRHPLRGPVQVMRARCGEGHWLQIDLRQDAPNIYAIGAVIDVTAGEQGWRRWVHAGGTSYNGATGPRVHVGLGDVEEVDLSVRWPDGALDKLTDVPVDRLVTVRRGQ